MVGKEKSALINPAFQRTVVAIYNPDLLSKEQLISSFVVRIKKFQKLFADIKSAKMEHPEQHIILVGLRGMGKTTMLLRLSYEVENDEALNKWLVPVVFSEEEYGIARLSKFWETIAEYLEKKDPSFIGLYKKMDAVYQPDSPQYEQAAFDILMNSLHQHKKKLLLFIDNFGDMFKKFNKQEKQRLREVLMTCPDLRIVAGSAVAMESFFKYDDPLFELFKLERLEGLNKEETEALLMQLGDHFPVNPIKDILIFQPQRVETLRRLTGGIPRSIVLLFEIFADDKGGSAFTDLEGILDHVTQLYKHRMDDLSPQQQQIMHTIAMNWDAISVKEIVQLTRLESKLVSAQLKQLSENNLIDVQATHTKNHLYLLHDRFFNIWYLMRMARKSDKNRILWLIRFLEAWCDETGFSDKSRTLINAMNRGTYNTQGAVYYSSALYYSGKQDVETRFSLAKRAESYLEDKDSGLHQQVSRSDMSQFGKAIRALKGKDYNAAIRQLVAVGDKSGQDCLLLSLLFEEVGDVANAASFYERAVSLGVEHLERVKGDIYANYLQKYDAATIAYSKAIEEGDAKACRYLGLMYANKLKDNEKAREYLSKAIEMGQVAAWENIGDIWTYEKDYDKAEGCFEKLIENQINQGWASLGWLHQYHKKDYPKAIEFHEKAIEQEQFYSLIHLGRYHRTQTKDFNQAEVYLKKATVEGEVAAWEELGDLYRWDLKDFVQSEKYYRRAVKEGYTEAWLSLGWLYKNDLKNNEQAESAFRKGIEEGEIQPWDALGDLYRFGFKNFEKAGEYYLKAAEKGYTESWLWLGHLYRWEIKDFAKSETYYLKATDTGDSNAWLWLGQLYEHEFKNYEQTEIYFKKGIEQGVTQCWDALGYLYRWNFKDFVKAEECYIKATEGGHNESWLWLGQLHKDEFKNYEQAEIYFRKSIEHGITKAWDSLGDLYRWNFKDFAKAEAYYLKATDGGYNESWLWLGRLYKDEFKNYEQAEIYFKKGIEHEIIEAWTALGHLYRWNFKDFTKAEEYYVKATEEGHNESWLWLGRLFRHELKNPEQAEIYFKKGIKQDKIEACQELGNLYRFNFKNFEKTEEYYLKALDEDNTESYLLLGSLYASDLKNYEQAEHYFKKALDIGNKNAYIFLAALYFQDKTEKNTALEYAQKAKALIENNLESINYICACVLLWNNQFDQAFELVDKFIENEDFLSDDEDLTIFFLLAMSKAQYAAVDAIFRNEQYAELKLKDRFKPIWYALMYFMKDKYPTEFLRLPPELKQTVEEVIEKIEQMRIDYA